VLDIHVASRLAASGRHVAITGAGGWIGRATLELLEQALGDDFGSRVHAFGSSERAFDLRSGRRIVQRPLVELRQAPSAEMLVLHTAFLTKDRAENMSDADYRAANQAITSTVLEAIDALPVAGLFVASSGAAAKAEDPGACASMRVYGAMKRDDERTFAAWGELTGTRVVNTRIFNLTGPYINKVAAYAIASFIIDGQAGRPIIVRAPREVWRGYVAIRELMSLVLAMLEHPAGIDQFDSGGEAIELGEVAQVVAQVTGAREVIRTPVSEPTADRYLGDNRRYRTLLQQHGIASVPFAKQVEETADYLASL
jgi:UDP-glucuronate decarboxylase